MCGYLLSIKLDSWESLLKNHQVSVCLSSMMDRKTTPRYLLLTTEFSEKCVFSGPCQGDSICFRSSMSQQQMGARDSQRHRQLELLLNHQGFDFYLCLIKTTERLTSPSGRGAEVVEGDTQHASWISPEECFHPDHVKIFNGNDFHMCHIVSRWECPWLLSYTCYCSLN